MITSWPDMKPGDQNLWYEQILRFEGLTISVRPFRRSDTDVAFMRDAYLRKDKNKVFDPVVYIENLGLFLSRQLKN